MFLQKVIGLPGFCCNMEYKRFICVSRYCLVTQAQQQLLLVSLAFETSDHLYHLSSGHTPIVWCPYIVTLKLHTVLEVGLHQCSLGWDSYFPQPASYAVLDAPQDTLGPFSCQGTLLTHILNLPSALPPYLSAGLLSRLLSLSLYI